MLATEVEVGGSEQGSAPSTWVCVGMLPPTVARFKEPTYHKNAHHSFLRQYLGSIFGQHFRTMLMHILPEYQSTQYPEAECPS